MTIVTVAVLVFAVSTFGTGLIRRYAISRNVLDTPNQRSSHAVPTPRGGGIAIVVAFFAGILPLVLDGHIAPGIATALVGGGAIVAVTGFVDDHRPIAARWRLITHFGAAGWVIYWLGGLACVSALGRTFCLSWAGYAITGLALVWLLNLYNFMDGIDGIAGVEAVTVSVSACALYAGLPMARGDCLLLAVLTFATIGFLLWNFAPAKIFMGDAGSGFLGLVLGALALHAAASLPNGLWVWTILLGVFIADATITLARRVGRGEKFYEGHRDHAYQHAALRVGGHSHVTIAVAVINIFWLLPMAALVRTGRLDGLLGAVVAYVPLAWLAREFKAGTPDPWTGSK